MDQVNKKILVAAGLSTSVIALASLVAVGFFIYKTYIDSRLTVLQIRKLKREEASTL